jgi:DegV family protein with EDD domain
MTPAFKNALVTGVERVAAWSDVLDDINVFPVADGDTGRNLIASLTPLRYLEENPDDTIYSLLMSARGNSGNIAAQFFSGLLDEESCATLAQAVASGREKARQAVRQPVAGTMLTVLDDLVEFLSTHDFEDSVEYVDSIMDVLEASVRTTPELLPKLKQAGVVDSGALGLFIFLEGFFRRLIGQHNGFRSIDTMFQGMLEIEPSYQADEEEGFCIDTVIQNSDKHRAALDTLSRQGESVVVIPHKDFIKIHLHADSSREARAQIASLGEVVHWEDDDLGSQTREFKRQQQRGTVHIMTDAAGSVTRDDARELGLTLLDSYIIAGQKSLPETIFSPEELYSTMLKGTRVSTSQASVFERHEYYRRVVNQYEHVLYLCVGSVFTGNYDVAVDWKAANDPEDRLTIIDTGAASGRLGAIALATARYAARTHDPQAVIAFAHKVVASSREFIFLDRLKYLAAGGRMPKAKAVFGELLRVKPIVSPTAEGVIKVGTAKNRKGQLKFALEKFEEAFDKSASPFVMLEYTDNHAWVDKVVKNEIKARCPQAETRLQPLSLTSAVHMGPGTWAMATIPL